MSCAGAHERKSVKTKIGAPAGRSTASRHPSDTYQEKENQAQAACRHAARQPGRQAGKTTIRPLTILNTFRSIAASAKHIVKPCVVELPWEKVPSADISVN